MKQYYLSRKDQISGPHSLGELLSGGLRPDDQVRTAKLPEEWKPVTAFRELSGSVTSGQVKPLPKDPAERTPLALHPASRDALRNHLRKVQLASQVKEADPATRPRRRLRTRLNYGIGISLLAAALLFSAFLIKKNAASSQKSFPSTLVKHISQGPAH